MLNTMEEVNAKRFSGFKNSYDLGQSINSTGEEAFTRSFKTAGMDDKICPKNLHTKFAERSTISKYDTRNKTDLQIPRLNLDFSRKSFAYTGLKTWNSIPKYIRQSRTLTRFKNGLKNHFLS